MGGTDLPGVYIVHFRRICRDGISALRSAFRLLFSPLASFPPSELLNSRVLTPSSCAQALADLSIHVLNRCSAGPLEELSELQTWLLLMHIPFDIYIFSDFKYKNKFHTRNQVRFTNV